MITDEMIEKAEDAVYHALPWSCFLSSCEARELVRAALEAAYPLIAAQVLEEAVQIANGRAAIWARIGIGECALSLEEECEDIAEAIRALAAKYEVSK